MYTYKSTKCLAMIDQHINYNVAVRSAKNNIPKLSNQPSNREIDWLEIVNPLTLTTTQYSFVYIQC